MTWEVTLARLQKNCLKYLFKTSYIPVIRSRKCEKNEFVFFPFPITVMKWLQKVKPLKLTL